jgi:hypothetical protein
MPRITLNLTDREAADFAELVKRLARRNLGPSDLNLCTAAEVDNADNALLVLKHSLAEAGFAPR